METMNQPTFQYDPSGHSKQLYHSRHRIMNWVHAAHINEAVRLANLDGSQRFLDAGCSDGELIVRADRNYKTAVGADHNIEALKTLNNRLADDTRLITLQGDVCRMPFPDQSFDTICCLETLEHVYDMPGAIQEFKRILSDDGTLIVSVPIELGLPILLKQGVSNLFFGGYRGKYSWTEIWNATTGQMNKLERPNLSSHKGFDFRTVRQELCQHFQKVTQAGLPIKWLGSWLNTQVIFTAKEKS